MSFERERKRKTRSLKINVTDGNYCFTLPLERHYLYSWTVSCWLLHVVVGGVYERTKVLSASHMIRCFLPSHALVLMTLP